MDPSLRVPLLFQECRILLFTSKSIDEVAELIEAHLEPWERNFWFWRDSRRYRGERVGNIFVVQRIKTGRRGNHPGMRIILMPLESGGCSIELDIQECPGSGRAEVRKLVIAALAILCLLILPPILSGYHFIVHWDTDRVVRLLATFLAFILGVSTITALVVSLHRSDFFYFVEADVNFLAGLLDARPEISDPTNRKGDGS